MAMGMSAAAPVLSAFCTLLDALPGPMIFSSTGSARKATTISAPAYTSHFSCSRSTVPARRYRNATEMMAASPVPAIATTPAKARTAKMCPASPGAPIGFRCGLLVMMLVANALPRTQPARPAPAAQATGRQRREGRCPVGNSSTTNTASPGPTSQIQPNQFSPASMLRTCESSSTRTPAATTRPLAESSHPMGLPGRFHTSSAPTVANPPMNRTAATPSATFPPWLPGGGYTAL